MSDRKRVAYVIGFSAPPVLHLAEFLRLLQDRGWDTYTILSPTAASWVNTDTLGDASGHPVSVEPRQPRDPDLLPPAAIVIAAPLTFNSLNKWAAGISDCLALGLLNEALGLEVPVLAALCIKGALRNHPAYIESVQRLATAGVQVLDSTAFVLRSTPAIVTPDWRAIAPLCIPGTAGAPHE